jgi:hypothetical protein
VFLREPRESMRLEINRVKSRKKWDIQINLPRLNVIAGRRYTVCFHARADEPRAIGAGFSMAHAPWTNLGLYMEIGLTRDWQKFDKEFIAIADDGNARIHFDAGGRRISVELADVTLRDEEGRLLTPDSAPAGRELSSTESSALVDDPAGFEAHAGGVW